MSVPHQAPSEARLLRQSNLTCATADIWVLTLRVSLFLELDVLMENPVEGSLGHSKCPGHGSSHCPFLLPNVLKSHWLLKPKFQLMLKLSD